MTSATASMSAMPPASAAAIVVESQRRLEVGQPGVLGPAGAAHQPQAAPRHAEGGVAGEHAGQHRQPRGVEPGIGLGAQRAVGGPGGAAAQRLRALGVRDQLAEPQQHVLLPGQAPGAAPLQHLGEGVEGERGGPGADAGVGAVEGLQGVGPVVVVAARGSSGAPASGRGRSSSP